MADEPLDTPNPNPAPADNPVLPDAPPDRDPSAEVLDGPAPDAPADAPPADATADQSPAPAAEEPPYVKELRAEIASLKEPRTASPAAPAAPAAAYEPTPEQWSAMEKDFGFTVQEVKAEDGTVTKSLNVNPRQLIKSVFAQLEGVAASLRKEFDGRLHENTADSTMDRNFHAMSTRKDAPLSDISQHKAEIKKYLNDFYNGQPQKWSDPKVLEAAYFYVVGVKSRQKPSAPARSDVKVIHPGAGKPAPKPAGQGGITPQEREMMRGMISPKTGKPITDAEWLLAKGNGR